ISGSWSAAVSSGTSSSSQGRRVTVPSVSGGSGSGIALTWRTLGRQGRTRQRLVDCPLRAQRRSVEGQGRGRERLGRRGRALQRSRQRAALHPRQGQVRPERTLLG